MRKLSKYVIDETINVSERILINTVNGSILMIPAESDMSEPFIIDALDGNDFFIDDQDAINIFQENYKIILKNTQNKYDLVLINSYDCNLNCPYCYQKKINNEISAEFNIENIISFIERNKESIERIILFGGEILIDKNRSFISRVLKYINNEIDVKLVTNGINLGNFAEILKQNKNLEISVTLDGFQDNHDLTRGHFYTIIDNIDLCLNLELKVHLRINIFRSNTEDVTRVSNLITQHKWAENGLFNYEFTVISEDYSVFSELDLIKMYSESMIIKDKFSIYKDAFNKIKHFFEDEDLYHGFESCRMNRNLLVLNGSGNAFNCYENTADKSKVIGTLDLSDMSIIANESKKLWEQRNVLTIKECSDCAYAIFCRGGCAAKAQKANGTIYSPDCNRFKEIFKIALVDYLKGVS